MNNQIFFHPAECTNGYYPLHKNRISQLLTLAHNHKKLYLKPLLEREWNHYGVCIWFAKGYDIL